MGSSFPAGDEVTRKGGPSILLACLFRAVALWDENASSAAEVQGLRNENASSAAEVRGLRNENVPSAARIAAFGTFLSSRAVNST